MSEITDLIQEVRTARQRYLAAVRSLSAEQAQFKSAPDVWSVVENTEHITRAEQSGIYGMWRAIEGVETGKPVWEGEPLHDGKPIEQIIAETWKEKEEVPPIAAPSWGGSLQYWVAALESNDHLLEALGRALASHRLDAVHYPHPISGPLDMRQRLQFLRFHLDRHGGQVEALKQHPDFRRSEPTIRVSSSP